MKIENALRARVFEIDPDLFEIKSCWRPKECFPPDYIKVRTFSNLIYKSGSLSSENNTSSKRTKIENALRARVLEIDPSRARSSMLMLLTQPSQGSNHAIGARSLMTLAEFLFESSDLS